MYIPKDYTYKYLTASSLVTRKPLYLKAVIANPVDSNLGRVTLRAGQKSDSNIICRLSTGLNLTAPLDLGRPVYIPKGLYVSMDGFVSDVTVLYKEIVDPAELDEPI